MRLSFLIAIFCTLFTILPAMAQEAPDASLNRTPPQFYNTGIRMGTSFCAGQSFDCSTFSVTQSELMVAANQCIKDRFHIQEEIMGAFSDAGEYENCVLPVAPATNARGLNEWAVCCVKKEASGTCDLECTRYIDQKAK